MKKLLIQNEYNGEKIEIWNTNQTDLESAWKEIDSDQRSDEGGHIFFEGESEFFVVNGGWE